MAESLRELDSDLDGVAGTLSEVTRMPVVVFSALLAPGTEQEPGVTGQVLAGRWANKQFEADLPAGLVIAQMPMTLEDLVLGRVDPAGLAGALDTKDIPQWKALQMLGKGVLDAREERRKERREQRREAKRRRKSGAGEDAGDAGEQGDLFDELEDEDFDDDAGDAADGEGGAH